MRYKRLTILVLCLLPILLHAAETHPGRVNYMLQCQGCHKANGAGIEGSVPDLRKYGRSLLTSTEGRQYYVTVPGSANAPLTDAELADVLNYIITMIIADDASAPDALLRFDDTEVARYRQKRLSNPEPLRRELLNRIAEETGPENPD